MLKNRIVTALIGSALFIGGYAVAQQPAPKKNVSAAAHPNLAAAQRLTAQAFTKITAAQEANEFDLAGHAAKAKSLLDQANNELKQAAQTANANKK